MKIQVTREKDTKAKIDLSASAEELAKVKKKVLKRLAHQVKVAGFRDGKVPLEVAEKHLPQDQLQSEFINEAINTMYIEALRSERIRPVSQPQANVKAFVPFTQLDVELELEVVGEVKLGNYRQLKSKRKTEEVTKKDIDQVIKNLKLRLADKNEVKRAAKNGDEAWIDFKGVDTKGKPVAGAEGKDYPLALGSGTFIPGFEENVVGMKSGDTKEFTVTFPKDYGQNSLQNAKVTFSVTLNKVNEVTEPKVDDEFAAKVGPFKSVDELTEDIKKQVQSEKDQRAEREYENDIVNELIKDATLTVPDALLEEQKQAILQEVRQSAVQRGMSFEDYIKQREMTEDVFIKKEVLPEADKRIKAGLLLSEIGDNEGITVNDDEVDARISILKSQYPDAQMQSQLDTPDARREIAQRIRTEKVLLFLKNNN